MNAEKLQGFLFHHGEKFVVFVVMAASGYMVWAGLGIESIKDKYQPDQLTSDAQQVLASIDEDHTAAVVDERRPDNDIVVDTMKNKTPVNPSPYKLKHLLERKSIQVTIPRQDPLLAAPRAVIASGHLTTIAGLSTSGSYKLADLEGAEALEVVETQPVRRPPRRSRRNMMMGMEEDMMMMEEEMMMEDEMMDMDMMDMSMTTTAAGRPFAPDGDLGMRPMGDGKKQPVPRLGWFIAGRALLPHGDVIASFRDSFLDADGFNGMRDQPMYYDYQVQRADITDKSVDQLQEADWVDRNNRLDDLFRAYSKWAGFAPELVPEDYRDDNITTYVPPVLLDDYTAFSLHPDIPMTSVREQEMEAARELPVEEAITRDNVELAGPGAVGGLGMGGMDYEMDFGMEEDMGMGMDEMMGMGGMGMAFGAMMPNALTRDAVENKLLRFFDFVVPSDKSSPMPRRSYVYRIRYGLIDPNFPVNQTQQPKVSTLSDDVYKRIRLLMEQSEKDNKRVLSVRWSDWSEPSEPASLPWLTNYYVGPVDRGRSQPSEVRGRPVEFTRKPPKAKVANVTFNPGYLGRMPHWMDVTAGSVLAFKGEAEIIDPIALAVKKLPEAQMNSASTVIDFDGGRELKIVEDEVSTLREPGVMLLFDENGGLRVRDEREDQRMYRIYSFSKERGL
ncbi:MAG: hypothetical protein AAGD07_08435 [Planctomycetota bacterium]